jgi:PAS domain S-box-containing protein
MDNRSEHPAEPSESAGQALRKRAEELARNKAPRMPENIEALSPEQARQIFHELRVHQIELEMQNEELRRAQEELEVSRARYFDLYDLAPVGYCTVSEKGLILEANLTAAGLLDVARSVLVKQPLSRFIFPEDQDIYYRHRKQLFETGAPRECDLRLVKKDGATFWAHLAGTATQDAEGAPVCRVVMSDITERQRAEEALRESEARFRLLFQNVNDAVFVHDTLPDAPGRFIEVNDVACVRLGYSREEFLRMTVADIDVPEQTKKLPNIMARIFKEKSAIFETEHLSKDGRRIPTEISVQLFYLGGKPAILSVARDITERKQAEEKLKENHALLRIAGEKAKLGGWNVNLEENRVYWSDEVAAIHEMPSGHSPLLEEGIGFYVPEWRDKITKVFTDCARKGIPYDEEMEIITAGGKRVWVQTIGEAVRDDTGKIVKVRGAFQDITDRKRAEEALRKSEEFSRRVIASSQDCFKVLDLEGHLLSMSEGGRKLLEIDDITPYLNSVWVDFWKGKDREDALDAISKARKGDAGIFTGYCETAKGTPKWWEIIVTPIKDAQGNIDRLLAVSRDITERKRAEEDLKRIEWMLSEKAASPVNDPTASLNQVYGDLTELNCDGLILKSIGHEMLTSIACDYMDLLETSSAIYEANGDYAFGIFASGWCRMMDLASRALCDTPDNSEALNSGKWLCHESCWTCCSKEVFAKRVPVDIKCNGGIRLYAVPIFAGGEVVGAINFGYGDPPKDPEKLRALADAYHLNYDDLLREANAYNSRPPYIIEMAKNRLRASARLIGFMVEAKQAEEQGKKLESQLRQAQKMEAVGRLAGGVAHDFNNMLQTILGYSEIAMDEVAPDSRIGGCLKEIQMAGQRSADLTRQLLAFARKQTIDPKILDLNDAVAGMLKMLERIIGEDIDLLWKPASNLGRVKMDPSQIDSILANLCVNARDAIAGVGKVTIETENVEFNEGYCANHPGFIPGRFVMLALSDDGCGMDKATQERIFEPFFTTKELGKGTGLGMATVYGIVQQNYGFINVYSEPGKGTTFRIYLPRLAGEDAPREEDREVVERKTGTETVLLVEDEASLLVLATKIVQDLGYTVLAADRPSTAIQMLREYSGEIHLLMTDVVMPEMNGRDLWRDLVALRPGLKCLFVSGYTADAIAHRGVLDDGVNFLHKPFSVHDLAAKLREVLDG